MLADLLSSAVRLKRCTAGPYGAMPLPLCLRYQVVHTYVECKKTRKRFHSTKTTGDASHALGSTPDEAHGATLCNGWSRRKKRLDIYWLCVEQHVWLLTWVLDQLQS
jgi:hypothetical protein